MSKLKDKKQTNRASITLALGIEAALTAASMTKQDLARKVGCSPGHITDIEKCKKNPSQALIGQIATVLGMTPADLYEIGELKLDEQTLEEARTTRRRIEKLRTRTVVLEVLPDLGRRDLEAIASAASKRLGFSVD